MADDPSMRRRRSTRELGASFLGPHDLHRLLRQALPFLQPAGEKFTRAMPLISCIGAFLFEATLSQTAAGEASFGRASEDNLLLG
jgi:hypothetical protein